MQTGKEVLPVNKGERIGNRYKLIEPIGSGGMANVYLAHDLILDRDVAIKVMRYDFRDDQNNIRRFKREALATTEMNHPNIVTIYDVGEEGTNPYIVMEYIEGTDLKEYIKQNEPIPYKKAVDIMGQILSGVSYAHEQGIIHRDLKPQNILVDQDGMTKISDFGIAVAISENSITQTNSLLGSVHYISPEQARGSMPSKQSDVYSLGIMLYELLTGVVPFDGESAVSIALKHFQQPLPSLKEFDSRIPQALENVVLKATAKDKHYRYKSVEEMALDLDTALSASRRHELPYVFPTEDHGATKVIAPYTYGDMAQPEERVSEPSTTEALPDENPKKPVKKGKKRWAVLIGFLLVLIAVFGYYLATSAKDVPVPELMGLSEEEAVRVLEENNLQLGKTIPEINEEIEEGRVTRTNPPTGRMIKEDQAVDLYISTGRATIDFENYVGKSYEEVRAELTDRGFSVEKEEKNDAEAPAGTILTQSIAEGAEVVPDETTVLFTVSLGEAGIELEDLKDYSLKGVQTYIDRHNLNLFVKEDFSDTIPEGRVISQSPEPGKQVYSNENITVIISKGPVGGAVSVFTKTVTVAYLAPEVDSGTDSGTSEKPIEKKPNKIDIYLGDSAHDVGDLYREVMITEDTEIEIPFILKKGETGAYRILRDGKLVTEEKEVTE